MLAIRSRLVAPVVAVLAMPLAVLAASPASAVPSPDLVISEVYGGGSNSGAPLNADFIELFNRGGAARSTAGLSVQYASATGTGAFAPVALPDITVPPGGYVLVGMTPGANGLPLPTPDATGTIAMAAGAGKVALATGSTGLGCNGANLPCSPEQLARIIDLVGYGNANFFEGAAAPALSNTTSASRNATGSDTDNNSVDFTAGTPNPQNSGGPSNTPPSVTPNPFPITHSAGTTASYPVTATDDVTVASVTVDTTLPLGVSIASDPPAPSRLITVTVADTVAVGDYTIGMTLTDDDGATTGVTISLSVTFVDACGTAVTHTIPQVQGSGATSPVVGSTVRIEGVVTESYQAAGAVGGFYLQDPAGDGDATTSDGILVFNNNVLVTAGKRVRLTGRVLEFARSANAGQGTVTQIGAPFSEVIVCDDTPILEPIDVGLPFPAAELPGVPFQERYEGMRVTMPDARTVTEVFTLGRFGEIVLTSGAPLYSPTNGNVPGTPEEIRAANDLNRILLDDGKSGSNIYPGAYVVGDDPDAVPRVGDRVVPGDEVSGVFTFDFGLYRVQPVGEAVDSRPVTPARPRPTRWAATSPSPRTTS